MVNATEAFNTALEVGRAGRAQIKFSKRTAGGSVTSLDTSVDVEIIAEVYSDTKAALAPLDAYPAYVTADAFAKCLEETFGGWLGVTTTATKVAPLMSPQGGGGAMAYELAILFGGRTTTLRPEAYAWPISTVLASLSFVGPKDVVTTELLTAVAGKVQSKMEAAATAR